MIPLLQNHLENRYVFWRAFLQRADEYYGMLIDHMVVSHLSVCPYRSDVSRVIRLPAHTVISIDHIIVLLLHQ
jgi:exonuclease III